MLQLLRPGRQKVPLPQPHVAKKPVRPLSKGHESSNDFRMNQLQRIQLVHSFSNITFSTPLVPKTFPLLSRLVSRERENHFELHRLSCYLRRQLLNHATPPSQAIRDNTIESWDHLPESAHQNSLYRSSIPRNLRARRLSSGRQEPIATGQVETVSHLQHSPLSRPSHGTRVLP